MLRLFMKRSEIETDKEKDTRKGKMSKQQPIKRFKIEKGKTERKPNLSFIVSLEHGSRR
jgi:hypothetical protein